MSNDKLWSTSDVNKALREQADHMRANAAKLKPMDPQEARARELAALYVEEIAIANDIDERLQRGTARVAVEHRAVNNALTRLIDRMHDAVLDTDASSRPAGNLMDVWMELKAAIEPEAPVVVEHGPLKLDTDRQVFFYEQDHYYLSNFSAFRVRWQDRLFDTSEHAYHWTRFPAGSPHKAAIIDCLSAHDAFRYAQEHKADQLTEWDGVKVNAMRNILRAKAQQHDYVRRKLLQTGDRELVENSWRDPFWGWGENRDGLNMLGKLWMEVRAELRAHVRSAVEESL